MKIVAILASPRGSKSNTNILVETALEAARRSGAETEVVDITSLNVKFCQGCGVCWSKGECCQKDDLQTVVDKIAAAEGVVVSSPVYVDNMTAQLKTLFDRMTGPMHCQILDGKYYASVSTSGSQSHDEVIGMMNAFLTQCSGTVVGSLGVAVGRDPLAMDRAMDQAASLGRELALAIKEKRRYPDQEKAHDEFRKSFAYVIDDLKAYWQHDYNYWLSKGWIAEDPVRVQSVLS